MKKLFLIFLPFLLFFISCETYDRDYGIHDEYVGGYPLIEDNDFIRIDSTMKFSFKVISSTELEEVGIIDDNKNINPIKAVKDEKNESSYMAEISGFSHNKDKEYKIRAYAKNMVGKTESKKNFEVNTKIGFGEFKPIGDFIFSIQPKCEDLSIDTIGICYTINKSTPTIGDNKIIGNTISSYDTSGNGSVYTVRAWAKNRAASDVGYSDTVIIIQSKIDITDNTTKDDLNSNSSNATIRWTCSSDLDITESGLIVNDTLKEGTKDDKGQWSLKIDKQTKEFKVKIYAKNISGRYMSKDDITIPSSKIPGPKDNPFPDVPHK